MNNPALPHGLDRTLPRPARLKGENGEENIPNENPV
jgi:hypothetical protein